MLLFWNIGHFAIRSVYFEYDSISNNHFVFEVDFFCEMDLDLAYVTMNSDGFT